MPTADVVNLCVEIMAEHNLAVSEDVYEITDLYLKLCEIIINELDHEEAAVGNHAL